MYRSYSMNNMPTPITHEEKPQRAPARQEQERPAPPPPHQHQHPRCEKCENRGGILDNIQTDDIILFIVVVALLLDDCDDKILLAALGFIFLSDFL